MVKMHRLLLCTVAAAVAAGNTIAFAESRDYFRKHTPSISRSGQVGSFNFWGPSWGFDNSYRKDRKNRKKKFRTRRRLGSPNLVYSYAPDRLHLLADRSAKQPLGDRPVFAAEAPADFDPTPSDLRSTKLDDSLAQTIFDLFKSDQTATKVTKAEKRAILSFYRNRGYKPVWTSMDGLEQPARNLLQLLNNADAEGLDAGNYNLPVMTELGGDLDRIEADLTAIALFDIQLTVMAVRYAMHASGGRIVANRLSGYHDLKPPTVAAATALRKLAQTGRPEQYLASLHPSHSAYAKLKAALAEQRTNQQPVEIAVPIPPGPTILPGRNDHRIPDIRARMNKDGHLEAPDVEIIPSSSDELPVRQPAVIESDSDDLSPADDAIYDADLVEAIRKFQRSAGLRPDGLIGRRTIGALNGSIEQQFDKTKRIVANMERLRWLPRNLGRSHILVNQAAFHLKVIKGGREVWSTKVIVGKPSNQTSFFSDEMETVVFNPYWGVPQSIITNEMLPKLVNDPSYLDRLGYEVYTGNGRRVSSSNVDWWNYYSQVPFAVRQPPGPRNALGQIKFLFPNKHAIYLHDTPTKKLFDTDQRAYSHGCVRVQNPRRLAEAVLGWDQGQIASYIATGENQKIPLNRKLPVHITYFTAWPGVGGKVNYYKDIYGRDARLELAFAATTAALR